MRRARFARISQIDRMDLILAALFALALAAAPSLAHPRNPADPGVWTIDESLLPFDAPSNGVATERLWGVLGGEDEEDSDREGNGGDRGRPAEASGRAAFRIEVPDDWNGDLVMYAHGFRGDGPDLTVSNPRIRNYLVAHGFAWAASSYRQNGYAVQEGVLDTNRLADHFESLFGKARRSYITGHSMGGHITAVAIEQDPNRLCPDGKKGRRCRKKAAKKGRKVGGHRYHGAVPMCGAIAAIDLFDYFLDYNLVAQSLAGLDARFPPDPVDYIVNVIPALQSSLFFFFPFVTNPAGDGLREFARFRTGGDRPIFDIAFPFYQDLLFGFGAGDGSLPFVEDRVVVGNAGRVYQLDADPAFSAEEAMLNEGILRVARDPKANRRHGRNLRNIPIVEGRISIPVVSLHTLGDLFVPFHMEQVYAQRANDRGRGDLLVARAIRDVPHCGFAVSEEETAFADMVTWVTEGTRPEGDDILDPATVADPDFGCRFTQVDRLGLPACAAP